jgi:hypothetical protein
MSQPNCYCVTLKTTDALETTAESQGEYVMVDGGDLFVLAHTISEVAAAFPEAILIKHVGFGYHIPREVKELQCQFCKVKRPATHVHRWHQGQPVCEECWDERLRITS